ncbi:MAG: hypothetical protein WCL23_01570 [Candidatus Moraniibacteriota bacterium]
MNRQKKTIRKRFSTIRSTGAVFVKNSREWIVSMFPFSYAALLDIIELSLFAFALIITAEAVLPGIISLRLNLAKPFFVILILIALSGLIGRKIGASFPFVPDKKSPVTWIGISWLAFLLTLSSIKFSPFLVPIIVGAFFLIIRLFWKLLFRKG